MLRSSINKMLMFVRRNSRTSGEAFTQARCDHGDDATDEDICSIARLLADLYELQLESCTIKDAHMLPEGCVKAYGNDKLFEGKKIPAVVENDEQLNVT